MQDDIDCSVWHVAMPDAVGFACIVSCYYRTSPGGFLSSGNDNCSAMECPLAILEGNMAEAKSIFIIYFYYSYQCEIFTCISLNSVLRVARAIVCWNNRVIFSPPVFTCKPRRWKELPGSGAWVMSRA